jgi:hypothetical protein
MEQNEKRSPGEEMMELRQKILQKGLVINRVPQNLKANFLALAENDYSDDYGLTLKAVFDEAMEYRKIKGLFFAGLGRMDAIETKLMQLDNQVLQMNQQKPATEEKKGVKLMSGKLLGGKEE